MKKPVIGVILGTVVYFAWGAVSWMALPWHNAVMKSLPQEQLILDVFKTVVIQPGFYFYPGDTAADGTRDEQAWAEKVKKGPNGFMIYSPDGREPMPPQAFVFAILGNFVLAGITMLLLTLTRDRVKGVIARALLVTSLGLLAAAAVHVPYWNWFHFPADFTAVAIMDVLVGFLLLGLVQAKFVQES